MIYAIRGAITAFNTDSDILRASNELFDAIVETNKLDTSDIFSVMVSSTSDLVSSYPAKGVRQSKYYNNAIALFSTLEPPIENSLCRCIRIMLQLQTKTDIYIYPKHVYLGRAKILRPDINTISIALDGPAGAGKSTLAKILAQSLDIAYLDTGAMYRAIAVKMIAQKMYVGGKLVADDKRVLDIMLATSIEFRSVSGESRILVDDTDVTKEIREHAISKAASDISANAIVRRELVDMQRRIASKASCVLDGRDIGTVVLPKADYKFFVTASIDERAKRRERQLLAKGERVDFAAVKADIETRDYNDSHREQSPLRQAEDAVLIDSTNQRVQDTIKQMMDIIFLRGKV